MIPSFSLLVVLKYLADASLSWQKTLFALLYQCTEHTA
jgi:hypothetical protein